MSEMSDESEAGVVGCRTVSVEDAGIILGISRPTAYKMARQDAFPVPIIRIGDSIRVSKDALDSLLTMTKPQQCAACRDEIERLKCELAQPSAPVVPEWVEDLHLELSDVVDKWSCWLAGPDNRDSHAYGPTVEAAIAAALSGEDA